MSPIYLPLRSSDKLDRLISLARGDSRDWVPKEKIELLVKLSEILERLERLLNRFKIDFVSISTMDVLLRLSETL